MTTVLDVGHQGIVAQTLVALRVKKSWSRTNCQALGHDGMCGLHLTGCS